MKNRTLFLVLTALILGAVYAYKFTDWFAKKEIQIKYRSMPGRSATFGNAVSFYLDREYKITSIKVISMDDAVTNKYPRALWYLVSDSNSVPVTDFTYGGIIAGMKPKIAGVAPEPLRGDGNYRVEIEAGKFKGEKDFQTR
jgi:hypothetical protein